MQQAHSPRSAVDPRPRLATLPALVLALTCALLVGLVHRPALEGEFVWDDLFLVRDNTEQLDEWRDALRVFSDPGMVGRAVGYYRPVLLATYVADARLGGIEPRGFHRTNVVLHAINTGLVWWLLFVLIGRALPASFGSLLFGLHPMQVQAVALVTGRNDLLMLPTVVAAILTQRAWARARGPARAGWLALAILLYAVLLWTKETGILLPLVLLAAERLRPESRCDLRSHWPLLSGWAAVAAAYFLVRLSIFGSVLGHAPLDAAPWAYRPLLALATLGYYVRHALLPFGHSATPYHDEMIRLSGWPFWSSALACLALGVACALAWKKQRAVALALVIFVSGLGAVLGFVPMQLQILDHRAYVPLLGLALLGALLVSRALERSSALSWRVAVLALVAATLLLLSWRTLERTPVYRESLTLWADAVEHAPQSAYAHYAYGYTLARSPEHVDALAHFERAVELRPGHTSARHELARALLRGGERQRALEQLEQLLTLRPDYVKGYPDLVRLYARERNWSSALRMIQRGLAVSPENPELLRLLGGTLERLERIVEARRAYQKLTVLRDGDPRGWAGLGRMLEREGRHAEAARALVRAADLAPNDSAIATDAARALLRSGDAAGARRYLERSR